MFDVGFSELVLIAVLALLVLGPKRLPEVARAAGRWMAQLRRFITNVKQDFHHELNGEELTELRKLKQELDDTRRAFADSGNRLVKDLAETPTGVSVASASSAPVGTAFDAPAELSNACPPKKSRSPRRGKRKSVTKTRHGRKAKTAKRR